MVNHNLRQSRTQSNPAAETRHFGGLQRYADCLGSGLDRQLTARLTALAHCLSGAAPQGVRAQDMRV